MQAELAQSLTNQAMGDAIFSKTGIAPVSENSLASMKKRLADKI